MSWNLQEQIIPISDFHSLSFYIAVLPELSRSKPRVSLQILLGNFQKLPTRYWLSSLKLGPFGFVAVPARA